MQEELIRALINVDEEVNQELKETYGIDLLNDHITGYNFYNISNSIYLSFANKDFEYLFKNKEGHNYLVKVFYDENIYLPISLELVSTENGEKFWFQFEYGIMSVISEADKVSFDLIRLIFNLGGIGEEDL